MKKKKNKKNQKKKFVLKEKMKMMEINILKEKSKQNK